MNAHAWKPVYCFLSCYKKCRIYFKHNLHLTNRGLQWNNLLCLWLRKVSLCGALNQEIRKIELQYRPKISGSVKLHIIDSWGKLGSILTFKCDDLSALKDLCKGPLHHITISWIQAWWPFCTSTFMSPLHHIQKYPKSHRNRIRHSCIATH